MMEHDHDAHDDEPITTQETDGKTCIDSQVAGHDDNTDAFPGEDASEGEGGIEVAVREVDADVLDKDVSTLSVWVEI